MNDEILISVIVPTFNRIKVLERCINSVLYQTYNNWELIVVDDRSTDNSFQIVQNNVKVDSRIKFFIRPINRIKGANTCRNIGIEKAIGQYVAFLDSDDEWSNDRLENLLDFIKVTGAKAIYSGAREIVFNSERFRKSRSIKNNESVFDFLISFDTYAPTPSLVVVSGILKTVKFDDRLQRHQDFDFFIKVSQVINWVYFETCDIIVYNEKKTHAKIDFESCVLFYNKYKHKSFSRYKRINYLNYISESCAKINPNIEVLKFYKNELKKEGVRLTLRQNFLFKFPIFFFILFRLKSFIKFN